MANNVLGFIGIENFEIILYLSRILRKLERKVLLIDYSETAELASCIPIPEGLDPEDDIITHFGIDFTSKQINQDVRDEYNDILINFGFNWTHISETQYCTSIIFIINQLQHNIKRLASFTSIGSEAADKSLIIKDVVNSKISPEYIADQLKVKENVCVLNFDEIDMKYRILAQHDSLFTFRRITRGAKDYLLDTVKKMCPEIQEKAIKEAYKAAERGR